MKYKIGERVFFMKDNEIVSGEIIASASYKDNTAFIVKDRKIINSYWIQTSKEKNSFRESPLLVKHEENLYKTKPGCIKDIDTTL